MAKTELLGSSLKASNCFAPLTQLLMKVSVLLPARGTNNAQNLMHRHAALIAATAADHAWGFRKKHRMPAQPGAQADALRDWGYDPNTAASAPLSSVVRPHWRMCRERRDSLGADRWHCTGAHYLRHGFLKASRAQSSTLAARGYANR